MSSLFLSSFDVDGFQSTNVNSHLWICKKHEINPCLLSTYQNWLTELRMLVSVKIFNIGEIKLTSTLWKAHGACWWMLKSLALSTISVGLHYAVEVKNQYTHPCLFTNLWPDLSHSKRESSATTPNPYVKMNINV